MDPHNFASPVSPGDASESLARDVAPDGNKAKGWVLKVLDQSIASAVGRSLRSAERVRP